VLTKLKFVGKGNTWKSRVNKMKGTESGDTIQTVHRIRDKIQTESLVFKKKDFRSVRIVWFL
jgi:hypothetical protein